MITRRKFTIGVVMTPAILTTTSLVHAAPTLPDEAAKAISELPDELSTSRLIYLTPIKSDGEESKCKAEIWFIYHEKDLYVVTPKDAWRAEAIEKKLTETRIWVGDFGNWKTANEKYRQAPELMATGSIVKDKEVHSEVLDAMGKKYSDEWSRWGPRFKTQLEDGTRVMIKYTPKQSTEENVEA